MSAKRLRLACSSVLLILSLVGAHAAEDNSAVVRLSSPPPVVLPTDAQEALSRAVAKAGAEGKVVIRVLISAQGRVQSAVVDRSSGHEALDLAALTAINAAQFKPYMENGVAVRAMADIPFEFLK